MQPNELARQVKLFVANWILTFPEDSALPSDVLRREAARQVFEVERLGEPPLFAPANTRPVIDPES